MGLERTGTTSTTSIRSFVRQPRELPPPDAVLHLARDDPLSCDLPTLVFAEPSAEAARADLATVGRHRQKRLAQVGMRNPDRGHLAGNLGHLACSNAPD